MKPPRSQCREWTMPVFRGQELGGMARGAGGKAGLGGYELRGICHQGCWKDNRTGIRVGSLGSHRNL